MTDASATDARPPKPRPAPIADHDSAPYWKALHDGQLLIQKCRDCHEFQLYPRDRCLACRGPVEFVEASGRGTIYSFTINSTDTAYHFGIGSPTWWPWSTWRRDRGS